LTSGRRPVVKIIAESLSQHEKHVVPTSLSGIRVGKRKKISLFKSCIIRSTENTVAYHDGIRIVMT
jgi:hypothetical protein